MDEPSQATYTDSHDELVAHGGLYRDLYERQSSPGKKVRRRRARPWTGTRHLCTRAGKLELHLFATSRKPHPRNKGWGATAGAETTRAGCDKSPMQETRDAVS